MSSQDTAGLLDRRTLPADFSSGVVVALVALPLCLGVALASNAPLFAGILAGIVGGLVVGALSGSHTSVSGPAAGLTAVVATQIGVLGSFEAFLLAVLLAGVLQILLGVVQAGSIADFVPTSVIKGLLAAIGLILILKQLPHLVGHDTDPEGEMSFRQPDSETTFSELGAMLGDLHPGACLVGIVSIVLLIVWGKNKRLKTSMIPGPLVVVLASVGMAILLERFGAGWVIGASHLVQVPVADSLSSFLGFLQLPDWSALTHPALIPATLTIAAVASLETLLNLEAVDKLDPQRRVSPPNRELIAQGIGNMTAGLIGGLPVTSVIVRSSVNVNSGGKTKLTSMIHGALLLICVGFLPGWLNRIPLSSLAAVLIVTGFKLASPRVFRSMWRSGWEQFLPFIITIMAILLTDLLKGTLIGLACGIVFILRGNLRNPLRRVLERRLGSEVLKIELSSQVSFLNRVALSQALNEVPRNGHVLIDARETDYIDADVLSLIMDFEKEVAPVRGIKVSLLGFKEHYKQLEDRVHFIDRTTQELQTHLTPDDILQILMEGNTRFRSGETLSRDRSQLLKTAGNGRHPLAVILSGTSSRTPVESIFDVGVGDISCARTTAHVLGESVLGSLEYATVVAGAKLILVLGHTHNNAIRLAIERHINPTTHRARCQFLDPMLDSIQTCIDPRSLARWREMSADEQDALIVQVAHEHACQTAKQIVERSDAICQLVEAGHVKVVISMYDVQTGEVSLFSPEGIAVVAGNES